MISIKHITWRDGRPRFNPGPDLRAEGYPAKDLKHADGRWYTLEEAVKWSDDFQQRRPPWPGVKKRKPGPRRSPKELDLRRASGFVYFLWAGDRMKIGWSHTPLNRARHLLQGIPDPLMLFVTVPGNVNDERRLLQRLVVHRIKGEWFRATPRALEVIMLELGRAVTIADAAENKTGSVSHETPTVS